MADFLSANIQAQVLSVQVKDQRAGCASRDLTHLFYLYREVVSEMCSRESSSIGCLLLFCVYQEDLRLCSKKSQSRFLRMTFDFFLFASM